MGGFTATYTSSINGLDCSCHDTTGRPAARSDNSYLVRFPSKYSDMVILSLLDIYQELEP